MRRTLLALACVCSLAPTARAEPLRVALSDVSGPEGAATRRALTKALRERGEVVIAPSSVAAAKRKHGDRKVRVMRALDADLLIEGTSTRAKTDLRMFRRGSSRSVHLRSKARDVQTRVADLLRAYDANRPSEAAVIAAREEEREAEPEAVVEPEAPTPDAEVQEVVVEPGGDVVVDPEAPLEPPAPRGKRRFVRDLGRFPRAFEGAVLLGFVTRKLRFQDDLFDRAGGYTLRAAPSIGLSARAYPLTRLTTPVLRDLGLALRGEQDFVEASSRDGVTFRTYGSNWDLDLLYRFPFGRFQANVWLGYHRRAFSIDSALARPGQDNLPGVPNVRYQGVRLGGEGRMHVIGGLFVDLRLSYIAIPTSGAIHSALWFPNGTAAGLELAGDVVYRFNAFMDARLGIHFDRVSHKLNPEPGDRYIVGGAADRYTVFGLGLGFYR